MEQVAETDIAFRNDYKHRINPNLMTVLLADAVPVVKEIQFRYEEVRRGYCKSFLPLNYMSSNQHGTHQAMLIGMAGDYTGGLAFASLITDEPILGIHEVLPDKAMSLWLVSADMKYVKPSTDDLIIEATVDVDNMGAYNRRYHEGKSLFVNVEVVFNDPDGEIVAKGLFRYYCKKKTSLVAPKNGELANVMFEHMLKTSAKMIARLRATEAEKQKPLFIDKYAVLAAGKQGKLIGDKFANILPQLQNMVAARTHHLDNILRAGKNIFKQVVFIGAGLDYRMYRLKELFEDKIVFKLDLPEMLEERNRVSFLFEEKPLIDEVDIPCNFITQSIAEHLFVNGFNIEDPALFIFEGCSMYFTEEENSVILEQLNGLLKLNTESRLWMDVVDRDIVDGSCPSATVKSFLKNMARLGEPFVFGIANLPEFFNSFNMQLEIVANTTNVFENVQDDIYRLYNFLVLKIA